MAAEGEKRLGKYLLREQIGRGGMGAVYRATDTRLQRDVALKFLPADLAAHQEAVRRFLREARVAARLNHPNVVSIHDVDQQQGRCFLVMELVTGGTIHDRLKDGPLPWREATRITADACRGLAAAHEAGLVHRDIKPSNLMLSAAGIVKLTDFGLAKVADAAAAAGVKLTTSGTILGTPQYMSPEQCKTEPLDGRSDLYSLGATYYTMLTGKPPFADVPPMQMMFAHCSKPAPDPRASRPELPARCAEIALKALAKFRSERFASAQEMLAALEELLATSAPDTARATDSPASATASPELNTRTLSATALRTAFIPRRRLLLALGAVGAAGVAVPAAWYALRPPAVPPGPQAAASPAPRKVTLRLASKIPDLRAAVRGVAFSADGATLYSGAVDGKVCAWNVATQGLEHEFEQNAKAIRALAANQKWLAAGSEAGTVWLWKLASRKREAVLDDLGSEVAALAISPDGTRLAVGTFAGVRLYELHDSGPKLLKVLGTSAGPPPVCYMVLSVAFSPDASLIAATSWDRKTIIVWKAANGELVEYHDSLPHEPCAVAFLPDNERLLFGAMNYGVNLLRRSGREVVPLPESSRIGSRTIAVLPGGQAAFSIGDWGGVICQFDLDELSPPRRIESQTATGAFGLAISPDGKRVATSGGDEAANKGHILIWDVVPADAES